MARVKYIPWYPFLLALSSVLAMLAHNISEVQAIVIIRPVIVLLVGCSLLLIFLRLTFRDWQKAGTVTAVWILLFITYGHLYGALEGSSGIGSVVGRHRVLLPLYATLFLSSFLLAFRGRRAQLPFTPALNLFGILLLVFPIFQLSAAAANQTQGESEASKWTFAQPELQPLHPESLPDIYFIVLDTYTSSTALKEDFSFDNSGFERSLREMGFYVAESSQSNYTYTQASIAATLNLEYLSILQDRLRTVNLESNPWILMRQSLVRHQLERIGYRTVAFESSYEWSRIKDADIFLGEARSSITWQELDPFERMWANSTLLLLINEMDVKIRSGSSAGGIDHPWSDHIRKQIFILKTLPEIADNPAPTFTYAHILIPHVPYVFAGDGQVLTDPGYFSGKNAGPADESYLQKGYTEEITYINTRMKEILGEILSRSNIPPIIILMGDHGLRDANRTKIFYALYLPDNGESNLYPTISPVNTFRVIFDRYFGTSYGLLPDITYVQD